MRERGCLKLKNVFLIAGSLLLLPVAAMAVDVPATITTAISDSISLAGTVGTAAIGIFAAMVIFRVVKRAFNAGK